MPKGIYNHDTTTGWGPMPKKKKTKPCDFCGKDVVVRSLKSKAVCKDNWDCQSKDEQRQQKYRREQSYAKWKRKQDAKSQAS